MLLLLFGMIIFAFLFLGAIIFLACILAPPARRYALSAALWCAVWGPCSVGLMTLAGLGLVAQAFITKAGDLERFHAPRLLAAFGWGYLILGILITALVATAAAWLHQAITRRMTFALFRLYAAAVSAGIGSVFGWVLGWWMLLKELPASGFFLWGFGMALLIAAFAVVAYKNAHRLRGEAPTKLTWITQEEFTGKVES
jgi:hypothetical protein